MTVCFVDTSCLVALAFGEAEATGVQRKLARFDRILASPLLEAELFSALVREGRRPGNTLTAGLDFVLAERPLTPELLRVLDAGYVRGADALHLATALYIAPEPEQLTFVTLDAVQRKVAKKLGMNV